MKAPEVHASVMCTVCAYNYDACAYYIMGVVSFNQARHARAGCVCACTYSWISCKASAISQLDYNIDLQATVCSRCACAQQGMKIFLLPMVVQCIVHTHS